MGCTKYGASGSGIPFIAGPLTEPGGAEPGNKVSTWVLTCCIFTWRTVGGVISLGGVNLTSCKVITQVRVCHRHNKIIARQ